ncbi:MAG: esterase-like activity of phytase family protein, partial [Acidobacteriota bacterium]
SIPLEVRAPNARAVGTLRWRAGFHLTTDRTTFGGLSGMVIDGDDVVAVTDQSTWWRFPLEHDATGTLVGVGDAITGPLLRPDGKPLETRRERDAEEILSIDGSWVVSFEGDHRLWRYPDVDGTPAGLPTSLNAPDALAEAPVNGGMEAMTQLADGRWLIFSEEQETPTGEMRGWLGNPTDGWADLALAKVEDFVPTGLTQLPDGDIVVLERSFNRVTSILRVRMVRIDGASIAAGARLEGEELGRLAAPQAVDNFEAIVAREAADGTVVLYLLSDDNFQAIQRTLLLQLELPAG